MKETKLCVSKTRTNSCAPSAYRQRLLKIAERIQAAKTLIANGIHLDWHGRSVFARVPLT